MPSRSFPDLRVSRSCMQRSCDVKGIPNACRDKKRSGFTGCSMLIQEVFHVRGCTSRNSREKRKWGDRLIRRPILKSDDGVERRCTAPSS
jgi:hypothetical protein